MQIIIDTNKELSEVQKNVLRALIGSDKSQTNSEDVEKPVENKLMFPKIHGQTDEVVLNIVKHVEIGTIHDFTKYTDIPRSTISAVLSKLKREGKLDASTDMPKKYFIKATGNPELSDALKSAMGKKIRNFKEDKE